MTETTEPTPMGVGPKVYLLIRRKKFTAVVAAAADAPTLQLKRQLETLMHVPAESQRLLYNELILEDDASLEYFGITPSSAPQARPATLLLVLSQEDGEFEPPEAAPFAGVEPSETTSPDPAPQSTA